MGTLYKDLCTFVIISRSFLRMRYIVQKIKTHILYSMAFPENRAIYEIIWKNMVDPVRLQMTDNKEEQTCDLYGG